MKSKGIIWAMGVFFWLLPLLLSGWAAEKKPALLGKTTQQGGAATAQPLRITSQQLEADNKNQVIIFTGNIIARQEDLVIHADVARLMLTRCHQVSILEILVCHFYGPME